MAAFITDATAATVRWDVGHATSVGNEVVPITVHTFPTANTGPIHKLDRALLLHKLLTPTTPIVVLAISLLATHQASVGSLAGPLCNHEVQRPEAIGPIPCSPRSRLWGLERLNFSALAGAKLVTRLEDWHPGTAVTGAQKQSSKVALKDVAFVYSCALRVAALVSDCGIPFPDGAIGSDRLKVADHVGVKFVV